MSTHWPIIVLVLIVVAAAMAAGSKTKGKKPGYGSRWPLRKKSVLTPPEAAMFNRLTEALPDHVILSQVQLSAFIEVEPTAKKFDWHNRYHQMSSDFLICDQSMHVLAAVELDDRSHASPKRIAADAKKEHVLMSAGVPLIRWHKTQKPLGAEIRQRLEAVTNPVPESRMSTDASNRGA